MYACMHTALTSIPAGPKVPAAMLVRLLLCKIRNLSARVRRSQPLETHWHVRRCTNLHARTNKHKKCTLVTRGLHTYLL